MSTKARKYILCPLILLIVLIATYSLAKAIVFIPQSESLNERINYAVFIIEDREGLYPHPSSTAGSPGMLDNFTDRHIIRLSQGNPDLSPIENAFYGRGSRYWHGFVVFVRPMLMLVGYGTIRYVNMFHIVLLTIGVSIMLQKKLGTPYAFLMGFVLSAWHFVIFPHSLTYSLAFYVMMYAIILIFMLNKWLVCNEGRFVLFFLLIGSFINFIDFLTFPLTTLGIPLTICHILRLKYEENIAKRNIWFMFLGSLYWGIGYVLTWVSKWVLSYIVGTIPSFDGIINQIRFRVSGDIHWPLSRPQMLRTNFEYMYPDILITALAIIFALLLLIIIKNHKSLKYIINSAPILFVCVYPYAWYMVFANHSQIHAWFTYRIQGITIFVLFAFMLDCLPNGLNMKNLLSSVNNRFDLRKWYLNLSRSNSVPLKKASRRK